MVLVVISHAFNIIIEKSSKLQEVFT
jgi:hypothetical protein